MDLPSKHVSSATTFRGFRKKIVPAVQPVSNNFEYFRTFIQSRTFSFTRYFESLYLNTTNLWIGCESISIYFQTTCAALLNKYAGWPLLDTLRLLKLFAARRFNLQFTPISLQHISSDSNSNLKVFQLNVICKYLEPWMSFQPFQEAKS